MNEKNKPGAAGSKPKDKDPKPRQPPVPSAPIADPTKLLADLRAAGSLEDAVKILQPTGTGRVKKDQLYAVNLTKDPLPRAKGMCVVTYVAAARLTAPFTADAVVKVTGKKSSAYWTRMLAKSGHLKTVDTPVAPTAPTK